MNKTQRLFVLAALSAAVAVLFRFCRGVWFPTTGGDLLVIGALLLMGVSALIVEHYFARPTDVIASGVSVIFGVAPLRSISDQAQLWSDVILTYTVEMVLVATAALLLLNDKAQPSSLANRLSAALRNVAIHLGNGRWLYFLLFGLAVLLYVDTQSTYFIGLCAYAGLVLAVDPGKLAFTARLSRNSGREIGRVFGVQSKNVFLVRLNAERESAKARDFVEFRCAIDDRDQVVHGVILDQYMLDEERWARVLVTDAIRDRFGRQPINRLSEANVVHRVDAPSAPEFFARFVGIIAEGSSIERIFFGYDGRVSIAEGQLVEVEDSGKSILYQVVNGVTAIEALQMKNETAYIRAEAVQLGVWSGANRSFSKHGWVPEINSAVWLARSDEASALSATEYSIGTIPGTLLPVVLDTTAAISHHLAILGVTGTGKSVFSRQLIRHLADDGMKVICVDFTGEYATRLSDLRPLPILSSDADDGIFKQIDVLAEEMEKYGDRRNATVIKDARKAIFKAMKEAIIAFLDGDQRVRTLGLPEVVNSSGTLTYTRYFFSTLFRVVRDREGPKKQICVVLEEAHTIVPEWNSSATSDKNAQAVVNSIGQIALQGRKYGVGFLVIAQRTANVSKTVLTQCNTLITFQTFDNTSREFLSNYLGQSLINALPNLRERHAIVVGKGCRSTVPVIFQVPEIVEPDGPGLTGPKAAMGSQLPTPG